MQLPHRAITPDTVVFHDDGAPRLLPSLLSDPMPEIADDLTALARIVHFAITHEVVPIGPLRGRVVEGYSDSLITAIDRSLAADPARRPRSIGELRDLLGIVVIRRTAPARMRTPAMPAAAWQAPPAPLPRASAPSRHGRNRRWAVTGGGVAILFIGGSAMFAALREVSTFDHIARMPPESRDMVRASPPATVPSAPQPPAIAPAASGTVAAADKLQVGASDASAADTTRAKAGGTTIANAAKTTKGTQDVRVAAHGARSSGSSPGRPTTHVRGASMTPVVPSMPQAERRDSAAVDSAGGDTAAVDSAAVDTAAVATPVPTAGAPPAAPVVPGTPGAPPAAGATFDLQIQPWGVVYVDGVKRGISPPVKQLVLAPGRHAILVTNPGSSDHVLEVDTARGGRRIAVNFDGESQ